MNLLTPFQTGDVRALARLITLIERGDPTAEGLVATLTTRPTTALIVGITGPAGSGKSTLVNALVNRRRSQGRRVAVLAIDPSSTRTGGAALGDRLRLAAHAADPAVFIRSMATRGRLGGLADAAALTIRLLAAFGFDDILVETVGVGQAEIEITRVADVVVVVQVPGLGDEMQAIKAGLLEVADIIAVNKADLAGAASTAAQLRSLTTPTDRPAPTVLLVSATTGAGIDELLAAIEAIAATDRPRAAAQTAAQIIEAAIDDLRRHWRSDPALRELAEAVAQGRLTIAQAGHQLARQRPPASPPAPPSTP